MASDTNMHEQSGKPALPLKGARRYSHMQVVHRGVVRVVSKVNAHVPAPH